MYLFDNLPLDVIQFEIFPYLDWNDRNSVNQCLPPIDKIRTPLNKGYGIKIIMKLQTISTSNYIKKVNLNKPNNARVILKLFRSIPKMSYLIQYSLLFRKALIATCKKYSDTNCYEYEGKTHYFKKTLSKLCTDFLDEYDTKYPYKYEVEVNPKVWEPIQNRFVEKETWKRR